MCGEGGTSRGDTAASVDASGNVLPGINLGTYNVVQRDPQNLGLDPRVKSLIDGRRCLTILTGGDGLNTAFYTFAALQQEKQYDLTTKVDYIVNDHNTVFARISLGRRTRTATGRTGDRPVRGRIVRSGHQARSQELRFQLAHEPHGENDEQFVFGLNQFADFVYPTSDLNAIQLSGAPVVVPRS